MRRLILPALLPLVALPLAAADVYKTVDENGNAVYTDRPVPGAQLVRVDAAYVGGGPAPRTPPTGSEPEPEPGSDDDATASGETEPSPEQQAELRARNCETAQERRERYMTSHRLYRTTAEGEREYLSSAEIDEARAQAAADVEQWCN